MKIGVPVVLLINNGRLGLGGQSARVERHRRRLRAGEGYRLRNPDFVKWAHAEKMTVTPYTFRADRLGKYPNVKAEMEHFLYTLGVDGLFTNNPDQFPAVSKVTKFASSRKVMGSALAWLQFCGRTLNWQLATGNSALFRAHHQRALHVRTRRDAREIAVERERAWLIGVELEGDGAAGGDALGNAVGIDRK